MKLREKCIRTNAILIITNIVYLLMALDGLRLCKTLSIRTGIILLFEENLILCWGVNVHIGLYKNMLHLETCGHFNFCSNFHITYQYFQPFMLPAEVLLWLVHLQCLGSSTKVSPVHVTLHVWLISDHHQIYRWGHMNLFVHWYQLTLCVIHYLK